MATSPPNSLKVEDETASPPSTSTESATNNGGKKKKNNLNNPHPLRNLYVASTTHSMDVPPTISVENCSDDETNGPPIR